MTASKAKSTRLRVTDEMMNAGACVLYQQPARHKTWAQTRRVAHAVFAAMMTARQREKRNGG